MSILDREANASHFLVLCNQPQSLHDEHDSGQILGQTGFTIQASPWYTPRPMNLASYILVVLLSPQERQQRLVFKEPGPHPGWNSHWTIFHI
jgi:hypothetical protein